MIKLLFAISILFLISACAGSNLGDCCCAQYVVGSNAFWKAKKMSAAQCDNLINTGEGNFRGRCTDSTVCTQ